LVYEEKNGKKKLDYNFKNPSLILINTPMSIPKKKKINTFMYIILKLNDKSCYFFNLILCIEISHADGFGLCVVKKAHSLIQLFVIKFRSKTYV